MVTIGACTPVLFFGPGAGQEKHQEGKISSRPASMSKHRTALDRSDSPAKEAAGPTAPRPGPMLLRVAKTEETVVEASKLSRDEEHGGHGNEDVEEGVDQHAVHRFPGDLFAVHLDHIDGPGGESDASIHCLHTGTG